MGKVTIVNKEYKGWSNCLEISNGLIDLIVTTDVGPRIIRFGFVGQVNEFCEIEDQAGTTGGDEWKMYGGHRLWHSPEHPTRTYEPDNTPVKWEEIHNGIRLIQDAGPWVKIQKEIEIEISEDKAEVYLNHRLTNKNAWDVELSVWSITVMAKGGKQILPMVKRDTGLLPNSLISLWPYTKMNDSRFTWGADYLFIQQDVNCSGPLKIGLPNENAWTSYANHGHLFVKKYHHFTDMDYVDFGSSYETYSNEFMMELETLSPITLLGTDEYAEHQETWQLFDNVNVPRDEEDVKRDIIPLING